MSQHLDLQELVNAIPPGYSLQLQVYGDDAPNPGQCAVTLSEPWTPLGRTRTTWATFELLYDQPKWVVTILLNEMLK